MGCNPGQSSRTFKLRGSSRQGVIGELEPSHLLPMKFTTGMADMGHWFELNIFTLRTTLTKLWSLGVHVFLDHHEPRIPTVKSFYQQ